jgi:NAD(P)-dependent dehydrogenase (short-subunit alcohol dehydrogenase family)
MAISIDLTGRRAWISGVTSGIGLGIAAQLARAGCDVAGCGYCSADSDGARKFIAAVTRHGRSAWYDEVDLGLPAGPANWVARAAEHTGRADIVVSNAGRNIFTGAERCTEKDWADCINLDLASHWRLAQAAKPFLEAGTAPVIVIITSNHAYSTIPGCFPYNVAKAGLVALTQSLAIEWGPRIRSIGIAPGFIDTPGNDKWFTSFSNPQEERARTEQAHPVGRIGTVEEIGGLCAFLASPWAAFMSGATILVDGGRSAIMQDHDMSSTQPLH